MASVTEFSVSLIEEIAFICKIFHFTNFNINFIVDTNHTDGLFVSYTYNTDK